MTVTGVSNSSITVVVYDVTFQVSVCVCMCVCVCACACVCVSECMHAYMRVYAYVCGWCRWVGGCDPLFRYSQRVGGWVCPPVQIFLQSGVGG